MPVGQMRHSPTPYPQEDSGHGLWYHNSCPACTGLPSQACEERDIGPNAEEVRVELNDQRFQVRPSRFPTHWLPDTPSNRHLTEVW
jgi:hypothetical protein